MSDCRVDPAGVGFVSQELRIQVGDGDPVPVVGVNARADGPLFPRLCTFLGASRFGESMQAFLGFKQLAVTEDGSRVVFELAAPLPEQIALLLDPIITVDEGIYVVQSDGTGLRRLGPPNREAPFRLVGIGGVTFLSFFAFSPDGRRVVFTDLAGGPTGEEAIQIFTLDIDTGARVQLTRLPPGPEDPCPVIASAPCRPGTSGPFFLDDQQVVFFTTSNPGGMNPRGDLTAFLVNSDGTGLRVGPHPASLPDGVLDPSFAITGPSPSVLTLPLDTPPVGPRDPGIRATFPFTLEVFLLNGENLLQLTNFGFNDISGSVLSADSRRVLLSTGANPPARGQVGDDDVRPRNPTNNCQIFSIDTSGGDLRQLTNFRETDSAPIGCYFQDTKTGCSAAFMAIDPVTGTLVFYSSCDPFGRNPYGGQIFTMQPDGSDLRQITDARGLVVEPDGHETLELVGPHAYSAPVRFSRPR